MESAASSPRATKASQVRLWRQSRWKAIALIGDEKRWFVPKVDYAAGPREQMKRGAFVELLFFIAIESSPHPCFETHCIEPAHTVQPPR